MGSYFQEWGAMVVFLQETMMEECGIREWNMVGRGFLEGYAAVDANGRSGGLIVAWSEGLLKDRDMDGSVLGGRQIEETV